MGGGHVESEGGFLAQDLCLCGKVMPTIRKVGGPALAKAEASASAQESGGTVASLDLVTVGYRPINVAGRVVHAIQDRRRPWDVAYQMLCGAAAKHIHGSMHLRSQSCDSSRQCRLGGSV